MKKKKQTNKRVYYAFPFFIQTKLTTLFYIKLI